MSSLIVLPSPLNWKIYYELKMSVSFAFHPLHLDFPVMDFHPIHVSAFSNFDLVLFLFLPVYDL